MPFCSCTVVRNTRKLTKKKILLLSEDRIQLFFFFFLHSILEHTINKVFSHQFGVTDNEMCIYPEAM